MSPEYLFLNSGHDASRGRHRTVSSFRRLYGSQWRPCTSKDEGRSPSNMLQSRLIAFADSHAFAPQNFVNLREGGSFFGFFAPSSPQQGLDGDGPRFLDKRTLMFTVPNPASKRLHRVQLKGGCTRIHLPKENSEGICIAGLVVRLFHCNL